MIVAGAGVVGVIAVVVALLAAEVRRFKAGRHFISARQLGLRLIAGVLLVLLLVAAFVGVFVLHLREASARPQLFVAFWSGCLAMAAALVLVLLADLRELSAWYVRRQQEIRRGLAGFVTRESEGTIEQPPEKDPGKR